jgi:hypothetical protein
MASQVGRQADTVFGAGPGEAVVVDQDRGMDFCAHLWYKSNSKSKRHLRWLVFGSSTYYPYAFVASILAALMSSLI